MFTNPTGANLPQGIASAMLADVPLTAVCADDVAVLEVDEAFGGRLAKDLAPHSVLLVNLQVDQLNRFHEPARVVAHARVVRAPRRPPPGDQRRRPQPRCARRAARRPGRAVHVRGRARAPAGWSGVARERRQSGARAGSRASGWRGRRRRVEHRPRRDALRPSARASTSSSRPAACTTPWMRLLPPRWRPHCSGTSSMLADVASGLATMEAVYGRGEVLSHRGRTSNSSR